MADGVHHHHHHHHHFSGLHSPLRAEGGDLFNMGHDGVLEYRFGLFVYFVYFSRFRILVQVYSFNTSCAYSVAAMWRFSVFETLTLTLGFGLGSVRRW